MNQQVGYEPGEGTHSMPRGYEGFTTNFQILEINVLNFDPQIHVLSRKLSVGISVSE